MEVIQLRYSFSPRDDSYSRLISGRCPALSLVAPFAQLIVF